MILERKHFVKCVRRAFGIGSRNVGGWAVCLLLLLSMGVVSRVAFAQEEYLIGSGDILKILT